MRQVDVFLAFDGHWRVTALYRQRIGSSIMPSFTPSKPSHCLRMSVCTIAHFAGDNQESLVLDPVIGRKCPDQDVRLLNARAGAPTT